MTPHARAKKAAKALDLYEQALNDAMEVVRDYPTATDRHLAAIDAFHASHTAFRTMRQMMEQEAQEAKEQTA